MEINPNFSPIRPARTESAGKQPASASGSAKPPEAKDSVEFSSFAELVDELKNLPDLRDDVVQVAVRDLDDPAYPSHLDLQALGQAFAQELRESGQFST